MKSSKKSTERKTKSFLSKLIAFTIIIITFFIQIAIIYFLIFGIYHFEDTSWYKVIYVCTIIISIILTMWIYNRNINTSFKLTWSILILLLPFFGAFCYLLYGNGHAMPKKKGKFIHGYLKNNPSSKEKINSDVLTKEATNIIHGLEFMTDFRGYKNTETKFYNDATFKHMDLVNDLKQAKEYIFLEFFILAEGKLLEEIYNILKAKGEQGVQIFLIYDDVGSSPTLSKKIRKKFMSIKNMNMKAFAPYYSNLNPGINFRDHRKIAVIDGLVAYTGGDNLADEYIHEKQRFGYWRDNSLRLKGDAVEGFVRIFIESWYLSSKKILKIENFVKNNTLIKNSSMVFPYGDGPTYEMHPSYSLFINMIINAEESIYVSTPYFIIDKEFLNALGRAIQNGVKVVILTPSIPDKKSVFYLSREHYKDILFLGGKVYEYLPGFNHAKNIIIDNKYAFVGTVNVDYRSFFLHYECGVLLMNDHVIEEMKIDFENTLYKCEEITKEKWLKRKKYQRIIAFLLSFFSPLF